MSDHARYKSLNEFWRMYPLPRPADLFAGGDNNHDEAEAVAVCSSIYFHSIFAAQKKNFTPLHTFQEHSTKLISFRNILVDRN